jgi:hypothetical protein
MSQRVVAARSYSAERVLIAINTAISYGTPAQGSRNNGIIDLSQAVGGRIRVPALWTGADITFLAASQMGSLGLSPTQAQPSNEPFVKVRDSTGALLRITGIATAEAGWYEIPANVMSCGYVYIKSTNTGSEADVNQAAARELLVSLKT